MKKHMPVEGTCRVCGKDISEHKMFTTYYEQQGRKQAYLNVLSWMEVSEEKEKYKTLVKFIKEELK